MFLKIIPLFAEKGIRTMREVREAAENLLRPNQVLDGDGSRIGPAGARTDDRACILTRSANPERVVRR